MKKMKVLGCCLLLMLALDAYSYQTRESKIYNDKGQLVHIDGLSWSGFQDTNVFQGLQSNPFYAIPSLSSSPRAYGMMNLISKPWEFPSSGVDKNSAVSFKTLRLPIQPEVLYDDQREVDLNKWLSDKAAPSAGNGLFCKTWQSNGSACEKAVSPKQAFWTVLQELKKNNIRVMIDIHHRHGYGDAMRDGTVYDMNRYEQDISLLATEIKKRNLDNVLGIDIFNEPYRLNWFKMHDAQVPWTKVIATAANAVQKNNPNLLLFVEGPDSGNDDANNPVICVPKSQIVNDNGYSHAPDPALCGTLDRVFFKGNWGEDFKPLLNEQQAKNGIAVFDKDKFKKELVNQGINQTALQWLLGDAQAQNGHIVFSPHVYPAEVAGWETAPGNPSQLRFDWSWGFLYKAGYPIVLGEASWNTAKGKAFFTNALMPYLQANMETNNIFFWAIGYLGDTVSAIDPNSGELNLDVQQTLKNYFDDI
ncbi:endoglucanase [Legionella qingyii]|uniref:cellulase n=1 Tax=Legionella qingyii TaxID=2184757 RepID=A0A317U146_9GAMM|nr:cellulase family glycosylhydrolase [Legionella qingyii]PWY55734.1 endoglucanase [Legionella qingyii]RUR21598.1 endoglucanase [Legionella qingyii]RUR25134.1 endoglucanase [Legionella qingyii]